MCVISGGHSQWRLEPRSLELQPNIHARHPNPPFLRGFLFSALSLKSISQTDTSFSTSCQRWISGIQTRPSTLPSSQHYLTLTHIKGQFSSFCGLWWPMEKPDDVPNISSSWVPFIKSKKGSSICLSHNNKSSINTD